jgi:hypothetical protein
MVSTVSKLSANKREVLEKNKHKHTLQELPNFWNYRGQKVHLILRNISSLFWLRLNSLVNFL